MEGLAVILEPVLHLATLGFNQVDDRTLGFEESSPGCFPTSGIQWHPVPFFICILAKDLGSRGA